MPEMKMNETRSHPNDDIDADDTFAEERSELFIISQKWVSDVQLPEITFDLSFQVQSIL